PAFIDDVTLGVVAEGIRSVGLTGSLPVNAHRIETPHPVRAGTGTRAIIIVGHAADAELGWRSSRRQPRIDHLFEHHPPGGIIRVFGNTRGQRIAVLSAVELAIGMEPVSPGSPARPDDAGPMALAVMRQRDLVTIAVNHAGKPSGAVVIITSDAVARAV